MLQRYTKKKNLFNELIRERSSEFHNSKKRIDSDNLIYLHKTERRSLEYFKNDQNPMELFKDLRDGNINPKDQVDF